MEIILNAAECPSCLQVLVSSHRHDFRTCECDNEVSVDGGSAYLRRLWKDIPPTELSIYKVDGKFTRQGGE